eukprot:CAMPEP_0182944554 /NCGR_PEP_ID=MMETSP0105_2-20130417/54118_1 /TAXON_ID=81532 ORGANISM="Acanthoeca-like sp., Strain 10tr" /NCGR_SAMPLE_ID=MMETSP0105_2 /ASSEMBLY_ACC=CAM_ASM_000205 /LENGTH=257 /DNA_ID=CAMNT_0025084491 /DNA_START=155 /DNA_END=928 /DNA_ORIENTATION=+
MADAASGVDQAPALDETPELLASLLPKVRAAIAAAPSHAEASSPEKLPDEFLARFLRGSKYNSEKAAKRYVMYARKRAELFPDQPAIGPIVPDAELTKTLQLGIVRPLGGVDVAGRRVLLAMPGRLDFTDGEQPARFARAIFYRIEQCIETSVETQRVGICLLQDATGMSRSKFRRNVVREVLHVIQDCLPIRVGRILIVNQPWIFSILFGIIKLFLKEKMRRRVVVLGTDREALAQYLSHENTPEQLGGSLVVPEV